MQRKRINKKLAYIICLIVTLTGLLTIAGGTSYAVLKGSTTSEKEQIIQNGDVKIELTEHYEDINQKISVLSDSEGLLQQSLNFNIKNIGDIVAKYEIKLVNEVPSSYQGDVISEKYLKIGLEINGEEYGPFSLKEANNILDSGIIYKNELIEYNLRIWLSEEYKEEIAELNGEKSYYKIEVEAEQRAKEVEYGKTTVFNYTGDSQEYKVPYNGYYYIEMAGGGAENSFGAKTSGYIYLERGETVYFYIGKQGTNYNTNCRTSGYEFNGGGITKSAKSGVCGPTGGGATDVRLVSGDWDNMSSLISRIMVAGAGGGSTGGGYTKGNGGALYGAQPLFSTYQQYLGNPGTQNSGGRAPTKYSSAQSTGTAGSFGKGGYGGASTSTASSGGGSGGGAGYYGGSGASGLSNGSWPGGGGSSYISGYAGVNSVEENTTITHTNQTLHYSGKYFIGGKMFEGENEGNGYAKITYIGEKPRKKTTKLNNVRYIKNCTSYNSINNYNHWQEFQAIKDGVNIAKGKTVIGTSAENTSRPYSKATDGDVSYDNYAQASSQTVNQCITIDLEEEYDLDEIAVWNYFGDQRTYYDNITSVSSDNNIWTEVIDEASIETSNGHRINAYTDTYNGYIRDSLMLWYDGYANTGTTRNTTATTWKDLSGNNNNGTVSGATWYDNYLSFDGTNDYVKIPNQTFTFPATYSFIYSTNSTNNQIIFGQYNNKAGFGIYDTNHFITSLTTSVNTHNAGEITLGKIYKIDLVYNALDDSTVYVNNKKISLDSSLNNWTWSDTNSYIGRRASGTYFNGTLKSFLAYNKALTEEELLHNYNYDVEKFNLK